ncbi:MAG: hypothetical protein ACR5LD_11020 [Symbiopectobacterium sp.]
MNESGTLEEILRWTSPTPYNRRTATRDVDFSGNRIKVGKKMMLWCVHLPIAMNTSSKTTSPLISAARKCPFVVRGRVGHCCLGYSWQRWRCGLYFGNC